MTRILLLAVVAVTAFIVNPGFGCNPLEGTFEYGVAEMRAAVEGTWKLRVPGKPEATLTIAQAAGVQQHAARASLVRSAGACGQRSFVRTAGACIDESDMPLEIKVAGMPVKTVPTGILRVRGLLFHAGELELHFDDFGVYAQITPSGTVESVTTLRNSQNGIATLVRVR